MSATRLKRRLAKILLALAMPVMLAMLVLLLPILLPAAAAREAWTARKLARTRCVTCGERVGLAEICRAKREARARGAAIVSTMLAALRRPRVVVAWDVTCPSVLLSPNCLTTVHANMTAIRRRDTSCGHTYLYRPDVLRPALVPGEPRGKGQAV